LLEAVWLEIGYGDGDAVAGSDQFVDV
jgi:hypothetical protein